MTIMEDDLRADIELALHEVVDKRGTQFGSKIHPIILENYKNGRVNFFLENIPDATPQDYVLHVVDNYARLSSYLQCVQIDRSPEVWKPLYEHLQKLSYNFLRRNSLYPGNATFQLAVDCAADAATAILKARFPYDTDFEPWAYNFVKFACLKCIEKAAKRSSNIKEVLYQDGGLDNFIGPDLQSHRWGIIIDVINAYLELTENRQQVLQLRYEYGLSSKEIAIRLRKSISAVDKLHFDAIKQLRQILNFEAK